MYYELCMHSLEYNPIFSDLWLISKTFLNMVIKALYKNPQGWEPYKLLRELILESNNYNCWQFLSLTELKSTALSHSSSMSWSPGWFAADDFKVPQSRTWVLGFPMPAGSSPGMEWDPESWVPKSHYLALDILSTLSISSALQLAGRWPQTSTFNYPSVPPLSHRSDM